MNSAAKSVRLSASADEVVAHSEQLLTDRQARLFFRSVLGASPSADGWVVPRRRLPLADLVVRINSWLEGHGYEVAREGIADEAVEREIRRRRSYQRTKESASAFRAGKRAIDLEEVGSVLAAAGWSEDRPLRAHQSEGVAHALAAINSANFSVPGSGKTATSLAIAATHYASETVDVVLVIGPLACFDPWEREARAVLSSTFRTLRIRGTAAQRRDRYARVRRGDIVLISYATASADLAPLRELMRSWKTMLVVDESHRIKRLRGGLWAGSVIELAKYATVRTILSGTPMPQSGKDLYSQLSVLWPGGELAGRPDAFAARVDNNFSGVLTDVRPFVSRVPKAALNLPPYQTFRHEIPLRGTQAEVYELIANRFRRRIIDAATWADKLAALKRGRPIRLLQAAANPDLFNHGDQYFRLSPIENPDPTLMERLAAYRGSELPAKSQRALQLVNEIAASDGKVVCWSNFVANLDQFSRLVRETTGLPIFQIDGRMPAGDDALHAAAPRTADEAGEEDTRERVIHRFLTTDGPAVLVTNPASCSESISLHMSCRNAIYLDRTYDCALFLQSIDRIHRLGLPDDARVEIHILLATMDGQPSVDHLVDASLTMKEAVMRVLLEDVELRPLELQEDPSADAEGDEADLASLLRFLMGDVGA